MNLHSLNPQESELLRYMEYLYPHWTWRQDPNGESVQYHTQTGRGWTPLDDFTYWSSEASNYFRNNP